MALKIGVLSLQGDFERHASALAECGVEPIFIRRPEQVTGIQGLVIPGGESTTIGRLLFRFGLFEPLAALLHDGLPTFGTCAGVIVLASEIAGYDQPHFGVLDVTVERNAYGPQTESFETSIPAPVLGEEPLPAVFIRAPVISRVGNGVEVLARFEDNPVLVRQKNILAATFHPELTTDRRVQHFFLSLL